jgi:UDP-N-acetylglucosamine 1-carboxyvinyltransferase
MSSGGPIIQVTGGRPLAGEVTISGAKNSVLKLMAASLLISGPVHLTNVPRISDIATMAALLRALGVSVHINDHGDEVTLHAPPKAMTHAPFELVDQLRASIVVLGPLLARNGEARIGSPGGDNFGSRPIDLHLRGLEALGATFTIDGNEIIGSAPSGLHGSDVTLEYPSVGATENIVMAAVLAKGITTLDNAAREPEIADLCNMLVAAGAHIGGIGTSRLVIEGVEDGSLCSVAHRVVPDRVEAATYLACAAVSGGEVHVCDARASDMTMLLSKLSDAGATVTDTGIGVWLRAPERLRAIDVATLPYPGVATDYKPMITAMLSVADGVSIVTENLFSGRFRYVDELVRLGANVRTDAHHAVIRGVPRLRGARVTAHDIRAGAAMVVAGLAAEGTSQISGVFHIDRGYADLVPKLASLGADITRWASE